MQMPRLLFGDSICQVCSHSIIQRQSHGQVQSLCGMPGNHSKLGGKMNNYIQINVIYSLFCLISFVL